MSNERVKKLRAKNLELGRKRTEMYLTDSEREKVKNFIKVEREIMDYYICPDIEDLSKDDAVAHIRAKDNDEAKRKFKTSGFTHLKVCLVDSEFERVS